MKTLNLISALAILLLTTATLESNAITPGMKTRALNLGGNDLLANTMMVDDAFTNEATHKFGFEEEAYIEDIPFSTECVTADCMYEKAISVVYNMDEEAYVDDIPFDTKKIAENSKLEKIDFEDEAYIDDIPFDTFLIAIHADFKNDLTVK